MLADAFQYTFTTVTKEETSREDGTPVYTDTAAVIPIWFDEPAAMRATYKRRDGAAQPYTARAAVIWTAVDQDPPLVQQMSGTIKGPDGTSYGIWQIESIRTVPGFAGVSHIEAEATGPIEGV